MNILRILEDFEESQACSEEAQKQKREQERLNRLHNAEAIERKIKDVIEPVMVACRDQIVQQGYPCDVVLERKQDSIFPGTKRECAIGIKLNTTKCKGGRVTENCLRYYGGFEGPNISVEITTSRSHESRGAVAIELFTQEYVERAVEDFIKAVFQVTPN